ncbi:MAG TPA: hypothetical protein PKH69_08770 [Thiobacillaceae bacterium]|nr:hypothetical protein [Thiobacillaceae bacterium]HNU64538.1 hypothetical protein [Thiobacillaceae bacterium]
MEWLHVITPAIPEAELRARCTLARLPALCADVHEVDAVGDAERGEISCVWGLFDARCTAVRNGVRYELLSCPNALQWTVTTRNGETTLHASINVARGDPEFIESIATFLANFRHGLEQGRA